MSCFGARKDDRDFLALLQLFDFLHRYLDFALLDLVVLKEVSLVCENENQDILANVFVDFVQPRVNVLEAFSI